MYVLTHTGEFRLHSFGFVLCYVLIHKHFKKQTWQFFVFVFATPGSAQGLLLLMHSGITLGSAQATICDAEGLKTGYPNQVAMQNKCLYYLSSPLPMFLIFFLTIC